MSNLLSQLRDEAVALVDAELPASEELRPVVGALIGALERAGLNLVHLPAPAVAEPGGPAANQVESTPYVAPSTSSAESEGTEAGAVAPAAPATEPTPAPAAPAEESAGPPFPDVEGLQRRLAEEQARVAELEAELNAAKGSGQGS